MSPRPRDLDVNACPVADRSAPERIADMAGVLAAMAEAVDCQSHWHLDSDVEFGLSNLREAARISSRRAASAVDAGPNLLRQMERTVLFELVQAALLCDRISRSAGTEVWPEVALETLRAKALIRQAAHRDPELISGGTGCGAAGSRPVQLAGAGGCWMETSGGLSSVRGGCVLSVSRLPIIDDGRSWMIRVGRIPVATGATAEAAALDAERIHGLLFDDPGPERDPSP